MTEWTAPRMVGPEAVAVGRRCQGCSSRIVAGDNVTISFDDDGRRAWHATAGCLPDGILCVCGHPLDEHRPRRCRSEHPVDGRCLCVAPAPAPRRERPAHPDRHLHAVD